MPSPGLDDREGAAVPTSLPPVVDAHVHLFPDRVFEAIWRWFEQHGWPVRYRLHTPEVVSFLLARGVSRIVALTYSHAPGMARPLNRFMAEVAAAHPQVIALGTVLPGEPGAAAILEEAFAAGLCGVKLHCHVQAFSPDGPEMAEIYDVCVAHDRPLVMHAGREPHSDAYPVDPYEVCGVERVEEVLRGWPGLRLCVPHLGADEFDAYAALLGRYDNLWLDTTMAAASYFDMPFPLQALEGRPERVMYGTDFPNVPYAWDRELSQLAARCPEPWLEAVLGANAAAFYGAVGVAGATGS